MRDATAPAMAASVPDINTDSQAERFTISLAVVAGSHLASVPEPVLHPCPPTVEPLSDPLPDAVEPGFHGVRTRWIRGSMAFELARAHPDQGAQFLGERYDAVTIG